jgi:hypothetical protein
MRLDADTPPHMQMSVEAKARSVEIASRSVEGCIEEASKVRRVLGRGVRRGRGIGAQVRTLIFPRYGVMALWALSPPSALWRYGVMSLLGPLCYGVTVRGSQGS